MDKEISIHITLHVPKQNKFTVNLKTKQTLKK